MVLEIRKANSAELSVLTDLALGLWPEHEKGEMLRELENLLGRRDAGCFLALADGVYAGFAQCQLRRDYVEGTSSCPVGYLEGIFVAEPYRSRGIAGNLLAACEAWAREQGCREFASDCELSNTVSREFHLALGFEEVNRIICFAKNL